MIVTINSDATLLTFSQTNLDVAHLASIELTYERNCNSVPLTINTTGITISNNSFSINLDRFYGTTTKTKFDDGVYNFTLTFAYPSGTPSVDNGISTTSCFVIDYDLKCLMLNNNTPELLNKYKAMFFADDCDKCDCTHLCTIYNDLILPITENNATDCECN